MQKSINQIKKKSLLSKNNSIKIKTLENKNKITLNKKGVNYKIKSIPSTGSQYNNDNSQQVER